METITIELSDDLTLGALRTLAQGMGKRLVLAFAGAEGTATPGAGLTKTRRRRKRRLSPAGRAAMIRNLAKARAVQAAKRAARQAPRAAK